MTNYRILAKPSEQPYLLTIQNVRQYHFHDVAKYENISVKESVDIKVVGNSFQYFPRLTV